MRNLAKVLFDLDLLLVDVPGVTPARAFAVRAAGEHLANMENFIADDRQLAVDVCEGYRQLGRVHGDLGMTDRAEKGYRDALRVAKGIIAATPNREDSKLALVQSLAGLGDLLRARGELVDAEAQLELALDESAAWGEAPTTTPDIPLVRVDVLSKRGLLYDALGDRHGASVSYEKAHDLVIKLLDAHPGKADVVDELLAVGSSLARAYNSLGNTEAGLKTCKVTIEKARSSGIVRPDNGLLSVSLCRALLILGDLERDAENREAALQAYEEALGIAMGLLQRDPVNQRYTHQVFNVRIKMGNVAYEAKDSGLALDQYKLARELMTKAETLAQNDRSVRDRLALSHRKIGTVLIGSRRYDESLEVLGKAENILRDITAKAPDHEVWSDNLATTLQFKGNALLKQGHAREALRWYLESRGIFGRLDSTWGTAKTKEQLAVAYGKTAEAHQKLFDFARAEVDGRHKVRILKELRTANPARRRVTGRLANAYEWLSMTLTQSGQVDEAIKALEKGIMLSESMIESGRVYPRYILSLANSLRQLAGLQHKTADFEAADSSYRRARDYAVRQRSSRKGQTALSIILAGWAQTQLADGQAAAALGLLQQQREGIDALMSHKPSLMDRRMDIVNAQNIARAHVALGQSTEARAAIRRCSETAQQLEQLAGANPYVRWQLGEVHYRLMEMHGELGAWDQAMMNARASVSAYDSVAESGTQDQDRTFWPERVEYLLGTGKTALVAAQAESTGNDQSLANLTWGRDVLERTILELARLRDEKLLGAEQAEKMLADARAAMADTGAEIARRRDG